MATKLDAASMVVAAGESMWIADGEDFSTLKRIFNGDDVGTVFTPSTPQLPGSKRFLAFFAEPSGTLAVDSGAVKALIERGKSLLPSGITAINGSFDKGDTVQVVGPDDQAIAVGMSNYTSGDLKQVMGLRSDEIPGVLGEKDVYDEAIHRNNMALLQ
jgi:glutamate 5-kinase